MRSHALGVLIVTLATASHALAAPALSAVVDAARYDRATRFFPDSRSQWVRNATFSPHWRRGPTDHFTYRQELDDGRATFVDVEAATGQRRPAFDHAILAAGLANATGKTIEPDRLPFIDYEDTTPDSISVEVSGTTYQCARRKARCTAITSAASDPLSVVSPDGQWAAYLDEGNLWIRSSDGKIRFALTSDASDHNRYAVGIDAARGVVMTGAKARALATKDGRAIDGPPGPPAPPLVQWSPDSRYLFTHRLDERAVREITLVQSTPTDGTTRPVASRWRYAMPNDPQLPSAELWLFDLSTRTGRKVELPALPVLFMTPIEAKDSWWSENGRALYLIARSRYAKSMSLKRIDPVSGEVQSLIEETGPTFVESASLGERPMVYVLKNGDILWFSERDGYGHLYLYDSDGTLKRAVTHGPWTVRNVLRLDEATDSVYISADEREANSDPYYRSVYRVGLSDSVLTRLTPEDADHAVTTAQSTVQDLPETALGFSPSGRFFLDTYTRADLPAKTVLRQADGRYVADVEQADISRLRSEGFTAPERFMALAADGKTPLYGLLFRPSDYDPSKHYPVLDNPYPGPQHHRASPNLLGEVYGWGYAQAYAELGFIVVAVDGRGTHGRSKTFRDESYGGLGQAGHIDDHVAVIRELARRYPSMDLDRVGIYGTSGGGFAAVNAMGRYPDFFKVGVADAGNHDQRSYIAVWGETYNGPESGSNYSAAANASLAARITGKLFLLHGDMDSNVLPSQTLQLADALMKANRDFDLLLVPNAGHGTLEQRSYPLLRAWNFFVRHLMQAEPPANYAFPKSPSTP